MEMQINTATMENNMEVSYKIKLEVQYDPAILLQGTYLGKQKYMYWKDTCPLMFIAALLPRNGNN